MATPGVFSLRVKINADRLVEESDYDNNELTEPFEFVQRNGLRVGFVRIGYKPPGKTDWAWPGTNIPNYADTMRKLFPVADNGLQYYELPFRVRVKRLISSDDDGEDLNWTLREFYDRMQGDKPDLLVGWLPNQYGNTFTFGGLGETVMSGQVAHVFLAVDYNSDYSHKHVLPHEAGHDLGLEHTGTKADPSSDCRLSPNTHSGYWPGEYGDSANIREAGFDTKEMKAIPGTYYDIMAYCSEQKSWISTFHYKKLFDQNLRPQGAFVTDQPHKIWVRGWAALKGDAARIELVQPPDSGGSTPPQQALGNSMEGRYRAGLANSLLLPLTTGKVPSTNQVMQREGEGNHCLQFMDASDVVLYERCFDLTFESAETLAPQERSGFVLSVPDTAGVARVVLVRDEAGQMQELTSLEASSRAPTLTITSPKSGDRWEGEHTITWSANDPDSDADSLRYDIQYSPDGKKTWFPLEVGSHDAEYTFSTDEILPGDQTYIRVMASDGFNTTSTDVGPLVVPKQPNSPSPPPAPGAQSVDSPAGGLPGWGVMAIIGGALALGVLVAGVFVFTRSSRRVAQSYPAVARVAPPTYAQARPTPPPTAAAPPYYPPPAPPTQPLQPPAGPNPFQRAQMEHGWLQGELAAGRISHQQFEAAINAMRVQDQNGRYWMLGAYDGTWYYYDGRSWVRTNL
jgi:hypothetical protein